MNRTLLIMISISMMTGTALEARAETARATFGSERTYPAGVTLETQFSVREQTYGSCHVFAAVAATRAACYRRTGRVLPISEGYLFALHLKAAAENPSSESFLKINYASLFSENNAGAYGTTFERIQRGFVRLDSEYSMQDLTANLLRANSVRSEYWALPADSREAARAEFETRMRTTLSADIGRELQTRIGARLPMIEVSDCQPQSLRIRNIQPTPERIVRLINAGFPVICQFHDSPPSSSSHVYVLGGYRANAKFADGLELMARNSVSRELLEDGRSLNCYAASVVYGAEEAADLQAALTY